MGTLNYILRVERKTSVCNAGSCRHVVEVSSFAFLSVRRAGSVGVLTAPPAFLITFLPPAVALAATHASRRC
jgi:hypothetical protein